ncbi:MAG: glycosyltransferase [Syntrophaceae bacterium]
MSKRVSVIIPVFNAGTYLRLALESVLNQSYQDFEIIAVDDGSTDDSREILASYGKRVTCISQANKGPSAARNTGIHHAKGAFIAFLDADDLWLPTKLEKQIRFLEENPSVDFVYTDFVMIDAGGTPIRDVRLKTITDQQTLVNTMLVHNVMNGSNSSSVMKKDCFDRAGYFDETMRGCEDRDMWIRIARTCKVQVLQEPLVHYRFHQSNAHKNIPMMQQGQERFVQKNAVDAGWLTRRKAYAYIYLDIARECAGMSRHPQAAFNAMKSCLRYPLKLYDEDDKYQILLKSLLPEILLHMLRASRK